MIVHWICMECFRKETGMVQPRASEDRRGDCCICGKGVFVMVPWHTSRGRKCDHDKESAA